MNDTATLVASAAAIGLTKETASEYDFVIKDGDDKRG